MRNIDYKTLEGSATGQVYNKRWWLLKGEEMAQAVSMIVTQLAEYDSKRQTQYQVNTRLYGNVNLMGSNGMSFTKVSSVNGSNRERVTYNVVQSSCDTIRAKMIKNKPKPDFQTDGADYKIQRKAKKLNKFIEGLFYEQNAYRMGPDAFLDCEVMGDGLVQVFEQHGRVKWERVLASELYVDNLDAFNRDPRQIHRVKNVDREYFAECFPEKRAEIMRAQAAKIDLTGHYQNVSDQITVCESWHLPSGPDAGDGVHCINLEGDNIINEEYEECYFPFAKLPWAKRMWGYWSQGIPEQIQSTQLEVNKLSWVIQRSMHLAGSFKVWMKIGSKLPKEHINNELGAIWESDEMPQYIVPPIVAPEIYQRLSVLQDQCFQQLGVSQLSAASQKPAGLNSGKALREYNDIESDRFTEIGQNYEDFFLQLARLSIGVVRKIYSREKKYEVRMPGKKFVDTIDWRDIDLQDDEYVMKMFPVSSLPNEPAGRLQTIQEYIQAGFLSPRMGRRLLDFPDLDAVESLQDAQEDYLRMILEKIVDGDGSEETFTGPEPDDDLQLAQELILEYLAQAKTNGLEPEKIELLRTFNTQVKALVQKAQPPAMPQGVQPQAAPEATPQSDLIQNTAGAA